MDKMDPTVPAYSGTQGISQLVQALLGRKAGNGFVGGTPPVPSPGALQTNSMLQPGMTANLNSPYNTAQGAQLAVNPLQGAGNAMQALFNQPPGAPTGQ